MTDNVRQRLKENNEKNYDKVRLEMLSMMSVEERAWEKYPEVIKHHNFATIDINDEKRKMYIEIATEQKKIDDVNLERLVSSWKEEEEYWIKRIAELEKEKASLMLEVHNKNKRIAELKAEADKLI